MSRVNRQVPIAPKEKVVVTTKSDVFDEISAEEFAVLVAAGFEPNDIEEITGKDFDGDIYSKMVLNGRKLLTKKVLTAIVNMATGYIARTERIEYDTDQMVGREEIKKRSVRETFIPPNIEAGKFLLANITHLTQDPIKNKLLKHKVNELK